MILQALDTIHVSSVSSENITTGQTFEVDDQAGRSLIERGLAIEVDAATAAKAEPAEKSAPEPAALVDAPEAAEETAPVATAEAVSEPDPS